jgi:hypothetical protein
VESGDSGVIERCKKQGFVLEARAPLAASRELIAKDLERDLAPETDVASPPHLTHPAGAERTHDLVGTQALPGTEVHGREE